nr:unnamed protein product [Callosobruchus chinensis]
MFWGGIRFNGRTQLIHIPGTMTGAYYLQNIINAIVQPLRNEIGDQFIFMDDNARLHHTRAVQQALKNGNIAKLEWLQCPLTSIPQSMCGIMSQELFLTEITLQEARKSLLLRLKRNMTVFTGSD